MAKVEIYTWDACPFCQRALSLLQRLNVTYDQHKIDGDDNARAKMVERTGGPKSVPQIFIGNQHIGGCDDLHFLHAQGKLEALLQ